MNIKNAAALFLALFCAFTARAQAVYTNTFSISAGPEWSHRYTTLAPFSNETFLGEFNNGTVILSLSNLPPHTEIDLSFDFVLIRSWDGIVNGNPDEQFIVSITDGPTLLRSSFCAFYTNPNSRQSYPAPTGKGSFPATLGAFKVAYLGYNFPLSSDSKLRYWDAIYRLNYRFAHTGATVAIRFQGFNLEPVSNESWGLDNVGVVLDTVAPNAAPRITRQPQNQNAATNGFAMFTITATTNAPQTYQWLFNDQDLTSQTNSYLVVWPATQTRAGLYSVIVSNQFGSTVSEPARLTIGSPSRDVPKFDSITASNSAVTLAWDAIAPAARLEKSVYLTNDWQSIVPIRTTNQSETLASAPVLDSDPPHAFYRLAPSPTLADIWNGSAKFIDDATDLGAAFDMHSATIVRGDKELLAYYIIEYTAEWEPATHTAVGRAHSRDGVRWDDDGFVLDTGEVSPWTFFTAQTSGTYYHATGQTRTNFWQARAGLDGAGFLISGQNSLDIPPGVNTATFSLAIQGHDLPNADDVVAAVDVFDFTNNRELAFGQIRRSAFPTDNDFYPFALVFTNVANAKLNFDIWFYGPATLASDHVLVTQGKAPWWDFRFASNPGPYKDGSQFYLAYEGANTSIPNSSDIGMASSPDGKNFTKAVTNPILRRSAGQWDSVRVGSPSLFKLNGLWYLFYDGSNGGPSAIGVATGANITNLIKSASNPILSPTSGQWDAGGIGRRSTIIKEGAYYYFAYEAGADSNRANWTCGLARSTDLLSWEKCPLNPILPRNGLICPDLIETGGSWYLYARDVHALFPTQLRLRLIPK
jgi:hypothetical protein